MKRKGVPKTVDDLLELGTEWAEVRMGWGGREFRRFEIMDFVRASSPIAERVTPAMVMALLNYICESLEMISVIPEMWHINDIASMTGLDWACLAELADLELVKAAAEREVREAMAEVALAWLAGRPIALAGAGR